MQTSLFTQSYRDSGYEGLIPLGVAYAAVSYIQGSHSMCIAALREKFQESGVHVVFNCKFEFWYNGHPNNGTRAASVIGDAYKIPAAVDSTLTPVEESRPAVRKVKTKTGWCHLRRRWLPRHTVARA